MKFIAKHTQYKTVKSHDFRMSRASEIYIRTGDILRVQVFMGHKKVTTTEAYIHPDARAIRKGIDDAKQAVSMRTHVLCLTCSLN